MVDIYVAIESALQTILFIDMTSRVSLHVKHIRNDYSCFVKCASDVTGGGGGYGGPSSENFWLKWCKIV